MPAIITFHANGVNTTALGDGDTIDHNPSNAQNKRGLGFYGLSHGLSVPVGNCQDTTFITSEDGTHPGSQLHNTKYVSTGTAGSVAGTVSVNGAGSISIENLPNHLCPLNIRFENTDAVRVQECELRIFDKANIENAASGVTTYVYEARHPSADQTLLSLKHRGRATNDHTWAEFNSTNGGSGVVMTSSPGASGLNTDTQDSDGFQGTTTDLGINHTATRHDWYVALAAKPESIGSKQDYALYFTLEYLA
jgi:hypothetical protein